MDSPFSPANLASLRTRARTELGLTLRLRPDGAYAVTSGALRGCVLGRTPAETVAALQRLLGV